MSTHSQDSEAPHSNGLPTTKDIVFVLFMCAVFVAVIWLGKFNFQQGQHIEDAKHNGEAWVAWLTEAGTKRMDDGFPHKACAGGVKPEKPADGSAPTGKTPGTWGACLEYLQSASELKGLVNSFFNQPLHVVEKCDKSDLSTRGAISFNNLVATPAGSAVPLVVNPLKDDDAIDGKLQIRVIVCDKGGYPIKVGELEF